MPSQKDEYESLRQELLDHQNRRVTILSLALTVSAALFATAVQFRNPYLPLFALPLIQAARVQINQTHYAVQRIASYIRVMLEEGNPDLNWETASYAIRRASVGKQKQIWNISPLSPLDGIVSAAGFGAAALAIVLSLLPEQQALTLTTLSPAIPPLQIPFSICFVTALVWFGIWFRYP